MAAGDPVPSSTSIHRQVSVRERLRTWATPGTWALLCCLGIFVFYFVGYPLRHLALPVGFDPTREIWEAEYIAAEGIGTGRFAARPGYRILSGMVETLTGRSQIQLATVLPLLLATLLGLAVAAFYWRASQPVSTRNW